MVKKLLVIAACVASLATAAPSGATECTPKGCSGGCHVNRNARISVDPETGAVTMDRPIVCYA